MFFKRISVLLTFYGWWEYWNHTMNLINGTYFKAPLANFPKEMYHTSKKFDLILKHAALSRAPHLSGVFKLLSKSWNVQYKKRVCKRCACVQGGERQPLFSCEKRYRLSAHCNESRQCGPYSRSFVHVCEFFKFFYLFYRLFYLMLSLQANCAVFLIQQMFQLIFLCRTVRKQDIFVMSSLCVGVCGF